MGLEEAGRKHELFQKGLDLFNEELFFEAHEVWEELWKLETDPDKKFIQGLIMAAGHFVHLQKKNWSGAQGTALKAQHKLGIQPASKHYDLIDLMPLIAAIDYNLNVIKENHLAEEMHITEIIKTRLLGYEKSADVAKFEKTNYPNHLDQFLLPKLF